MRRSRLLAPVLAALLLTSAQAVTPVPGTQTYYTLQDDPITDVNTSFVTLFEVNDRFGDTALTLRCANDGAPDLWLILRAKHELVNPSASASDGLPAVTLRLGTDAPMVLPAASLNTVTNARQEPDVQALALQGSVVRQIVAGLAAGKRLVLRLNRESGGQALTYTFSPAGFAQAWTAVRQCQPARGGAGTPARSLPAGPVASASSAAAPKFTRWSFTTCREVGSGAVRAGLVAGRAHLCELVIETLANGAVPVGAEFRYELEFRENGVLGKLTLDAVDRWPFTGSGPATTFHSQGDRLIFTLPLNVRVRPERVYTSINVTALVRFSNGSSKQVFEPLPIRPY
jgi:hypothetical protein